MSQVTTQAVRQNTILMIAVALACFHVFTGGFGQFPDLVQRSVHVGGALALAFLVSGANASGSALHLWHRCFDWLAAAAVLVCAGYVVIRYPIISGINYYANETDVVLGWILVVLLLEGARRVVGWFLPALALITILYALFGDQIPGSFGHRGIDADYLIEILYTTQRGIWGVVTGISATVIAIYVIFGAILFACGGGRTFMDLSLWIGGRTTGGAAKVAVVSSGLFGSLSGSAAANIATTGTFTIPMMIGRGYSRKFASAVEAVASSGGQLMPPIMGAGAFVMAELLGVSYTTIAAAALFPAILFYGAVFLSVHLHSRRLGYLPVASDEMPDPSDFLTWSRLLPLLGPLGLLIALLVNGYTPTFAAFWAIVTAVGLYLATAINQRRLVEALKDLLGALVTAGRGLVIVAVLIACAQIVVAMIGATGVGVKISSMIVSFGSDQLVLSLILAMLLSIVLGMGLPTTAAYLLAASVVAPAMAQLGVGEIAAHLFIFYFAILAGLSPPVCSAVFVAAGIARTAWTGTLVDTFRLALSAFLLPFLFIRFDALLMMADAQEVVLRASQAVLFVIAVSVALTGGSKGNRAQVDRLISAICAAALFAGNDLIAFFAAVGFAGWFGVRFLMRRSTDEVGQAGDNFNQQSTNLKREENL